MWPRSQSSGLMSGCWTRSSCSGSSGATSARVRARDVVAGRRRARGGQRCAIEAAAYPAVWRAIMRARLGAPASCYATGGSRRRARRARRRRRHRCCRRATRRAAARRAAPRRSRRARGARRRRARSHRDDRAVGRLEAEAGAEAVGERDIVVVYGADADSVEQLERRLRADPREPRRRGVEAARVGGQAQRRAEVAGVHVGAGVPAGGVRHDVRQPFVVDRHEGGSARGGQPLVAARRRRRRTGRRPAAASRRPASRRASCARRGGGPPRRSRRGRRPRRCSSARR